MNIINKPEMFLLEEVIKKNFASKYKDSSLGILWSLLKPLLFTIILTIVFSTIFNGAVENYPVYLLAGRCIYDFFTGGISLSITALKGNENILLQTSAPKFIFVLGAIISEFINFWISLVLLIGVMVVTHNPFHFTIMPLSILPIIATAFMVTGFGLILSIVCVYYTDVKHLWSVITIMLMYCSALFYPMDIIPEPFHKILLLNPLYWAIDQFRDFMAYGIMPEGLYIINLLLISVIIFVMGIIVFKKYEKRIVLKF